METNIPSSQINRSLGSRRKKERKVRLAMIFVPQLLVSKAVSLHHKASHPASKQANRSISFSEATGTGPSNAAKQRATVLHHFPSERPSRPQPLITRRCQSAEHQGLHHIRLLSAFCSSPLPVYHHHTKPVPRGRVLFQLTGPGQNMNKKK